MFHIPPFTSAVCCVATCAVYLNNTHRGKDSGHLEQWLLHTLMENEHLYYGFYSSVSFSTHVEQLFLHCNFPHICDILRSSSMAHVCLHAVNTYWYDLHAFHKLSGYLILCVSLFRDTHFSCNTHAMGAVTNKMDAQFPIPFPRVRATCSMLQSRSFIIF